MFVINDCIVLYRYVAWNVHEEDEGKFNFAGNADLEEFLRLSNEVGLVVILRAGESSAVKKLFITVS